jgi:hypothetical protein
MAGNSSQGYWVLPAQAELGGAGRRSTHPATHTVLDLSESQWLFPTAASYAADDDPGLALEETGGTARLIDRRTNVDHSGDRDAPRAAAPRAAAAPPLPPPPAPGRPLIGTPPASGLAGQTPLHVAARTGDMVVVDSLVRAKVNVDFPAVFSGATALHDACDADQAGAIAALVAAKASLNATTDADGWTPLHHACAAGSADSVKLLVAARASVNAPSLLSGIRPMDLAAERQDVCVNVRSSRALRTLLLRILTRAFCWIRPSISQCMLLKLCGCVHGSPPVRNHLQLTSPTRRMARS